LKNNKINLLIEREDFTVQSTIGTLYLNGGRICDTLENSWQDNKVNISCIPEGEYSVRLRTARESASRDYLHLLVEDVEGRTYILFHIGNLPTHTKGCVLVGLTRGKDVVNNSKVAMDLLIKEILTLGGTNIKLIIKKKRKMRKWLIYQTLRKMVSSKKFLYTVIGIIVQLLSDNWGIDPEVSQNILYSLVALVIGQGIADVAKK